MLEHVKTIHALHANEVGMDFVIISTASPQQQLFWQKRLNKTRNYFLKPACKILVVLEDWEGGAGNGLGTFYAFIEARELAKTTLGINLDEEIRKGKSVAIYHTSGYGQRLAPLTICEYNNKSAIRLPSVLTAEGELLTILEAVIKQTSLYAEYGRGRLSVFWGDQVFIPATLPQGSPKSHVEIFAIFSPPASKEEWEHKELHNYGMVTMGAPENNEGKPATQMIEKVHFEYFHRLVGEKKLTIESGIGKSLGHFTISYLALELLLKTFSSELNNRQGRMDIDPYLWMAATLDKDAYIASMTKKGLPEEQASRHHERIARFLAEIHAHDPGKHFFGAHDVGGDSYWWDYGNIAHYYLNNMKLLNDSLEGACMREFFQLPKEGLEHSNLLINSRIEEGAVRNSILVNVHAKHLHAENCLMLNTACFEIHAHDALCYNVLEKDKQILPASSVRADLMTQEYGIVPFYSRIGSNGKEDWGERLAGNQFSYKEAYELNRASNKEALQHSFREEFRLFTTLQNI